MKSKMSRGTRFIFGLSVLCTLSGHAQAAACTWLDGQYTADANAAVIQHPPGALFVLSDLSRKGAILPIFNNSTQLNTVYALPTPFDDSAYAPYAKTAFGLNSGHDAFLLANPADPKPGAGIVRVVQGSNEATGVAGDTFILGSSSKSFYTGKNAVGDGQDDFLYIDHFDGASSKIVLNGSSSDYKRVSMTLATAPNPSSLLDSLLDQLILPMGLYHSFNINYLNTKALVQLNTSSAAVAIYRKENCDLVAVLRDTPLSAVSDGNFSYATQPSSTLPALPTSPSLVVGVDQLAGDGAAVAPGPMMSKDAAGNVYVVMGSSSTSIKGAVGHGSFFLLKYNSQGALLWSSKHGTDGDTGEQYPVGIAVAPDGSSLYVAGLNNGAYGGAQPKVGLLGSPNLPSFIARFNSANGQLLASRQFFATSTSMLTPGWAMAVDTAGDLYLGGGDVSMPLSFAVNKPFIQKFNGNTLATVWSSTLVLPEDGAPFKLKFTPSALACTVLAPLLCDFRATTDNTLATAQFTNAITRLEFVQQPGAANGIGHLLVVGLTTNGPWYGAGDSWNAAWFAKVALPNATSKPTDTQWGGSLYTPGADTFAFSSAVDDAGNLYVAGATNGSSFRRGWKGSTAQGSVPVQSPSANGVLGGTDGFVAKVDPSGNVVWVTRVGSNGSAKTDMISSIRYANGALYLSGQTTGAFPGFSNRGDRDLWVGRMSPADGNLLKVTQFGSDRRDSATVFNGLLVGADSLWVSALTEGSLVSSFGSAGNVSQAVLARVLLQGF